jgi:phosphoribosylamine--glycine ligase
MRIALIGSGGREHAIAKNLAQLPRRDQLFVFGSQPNPGILPLATEYEIGKMSDAAGIARFCTTHKVDLAVVGPETPLMAGAVDHLRATGIPAFGPTASQARLESDKTFMRDLLRRKLGWGSPEWRVVTSRGAAAEFLKFIGPVAVKPIGLTAGKGVRVMGVHLRDDAEALDYSEEWIRKDGKVLLEERLIGEEFSRIVLVSKGKILPMPVAQDFKYARDGDLGPMTGGMGAYTCADGSMPFLTKDELLEGDRLLQEVVNALDEETGEHYRGALYGQFMVTPNGIRVIEFNARFGDPEGINLNALIHPTVDAPMLYAMVAEGRLPADIGVFQRKASVVKYLVPHTYPESDPHPPVFDLDLAAIEAAGMSVIYSSVQAEGGRLRSMGSRTLALVALGEEPGALSARMEELLWRIQPPELTHRTDVGSAAVIAEKVKHMQELRSRKG